jgi:DNA mismatch repair protein MutL
MPARAKFLKKHETELSHITQVVQALSLAYPSFHFQLFVDGKYTINCPPHTNILNRCTELWGSFVSNHLIALPEQTMPEVVISGAISRATTLWYDRKHIFFLINHRWLLIIT